MKKILKDYDFERYFESHVLSRGKSYYMENRILDIWCQDNLITAYIDGSEIYKVELKADNKELLNSYCSCPYSEDGEFMCKHIAAVLYHLKENKIPELEKSDKKQLKQKKKNLKQLKFMMKCSMN